MHHFDAKYNGMHKPIMKIRKFKESDREFVVELWKACNLTRPWNDPNKDIDRKLQFQPDLFFVGTISGCLISTAMAGYDGHRGSVYYLAVHPGHQSLGYGKKLMEHIEAALIELGCPKLNTSVRSTNHQVLGFYNGLSYSKDDVVGIGKRLIPDA